MPGPLRPGTPEFQARAEALGGRPPGASGPAVNPATPINLSTSVAPPPTAQQYQQNTTNDPRLGGLANQAAQWQSGLSAGSDADAGLALQRARDMQSGQKSELADQLALESGFGGARNQKLAMLSAAQGRELAGLNADLAADARAKQAQAFQLRGGLENSIASERLGTGSLNLQGTQANNAANLGNYQALQQATQAAQNLNLNAWQAAQQASAQQQQLAMQAQMANNQNYLQAYSMNPLAVVGTGPGSGPTAPIIPGAPAGATAPPRGRPLTYGR